MMIYRIFMYFGSVFLVLICFTLTMESEPTTTTPATMNVKTQLPPLSIGPDGTLRESLLSAFVASLPHLMGIFKGNVPVDIRNLISTRLTVRKCCLLWKLIYEDEDDHEDENVNKTENIARYDSLMTEAWKSKRFSYLMFVC